MCIRDSRYRPVKAQPVKVFINGGGIFRTAARLVDIFNAQQARNVLIKAESLCGRMGMAEVQKTGWGWREAGQQRFNYFSSSEASSWLAARHRAENAAQDFTAMLACDLAGDKFRFIHDMITG